MLGNVRPATALAIVHRLTADGTARSIREAAGLTLSDVARDVGVDQSTVSRWEAGLRRPRPAAAATYGMLLTELLEVVEVQ